MSDQSPGVALTKRSAAEIIATIATDLAEIQADGRRAKERTAYRKALAALVFAYWSSKFDHPRALLDRKRESRIMARLEECQDNVSDLLWALDGAFTDDWIMGRDSRSTKKYDDIETILRDRAQIEKFGDRKRGFKENRVHPMAAKYLGAQP